MPLNEVFLSDLMVITRIDNDTVPTRDLNAIDIKGVDLVKLAVLYSIIQAVSFESALEEFSMVHEASEDGPWIYQFPDQLVEKLATLDAASNKSVAQEWAMIEEFRLDSIRPNEVADVLRSCPSCGGRNSGREKHVSLELSLDPA